ncbi:hypothetical protein LF887_19650 [Chryseobacterium sp. MEBOG06]|uniref:hypothetical protein n=1 Tax=Chryseobacterium sp. MEBOG06 TaxID=2879938 RepID=UPI001F379036|nr:hypothetical protein [Chryseobacterium sp. MEBOG06]UKB83205.1 hypothetical protein LF887_19650 [Chryseobacterium sp. MEBOG06]
MKNFYLFMISLLLMSCSFNQTFKDRESDKDDGEQIPKKFYWELKYGNNQENIYKLFGEKFFEVTDKEKLAKLLDITNKIGSVQEYNLVKWETMIVKGSNARSQYFFMYDVKRGTKKTEESFTLEKNKEGDIKIVGYRINQDLLSE